MYVFLFPFFFFFCHRQTQFPVGLRTSTAKCLQACCSFIFPFSQQSSQQFTCALLLLKHHLHKASLHTHKHTHTHSRILLFTPGSERCADPRLSSLALELQVTKYVVELPGLSMGGWPAMGLKDNAVPRVALMTLKCWAIMGKRTGL